MHMWVPLSTESNNIRYNYTTLYLFSYELFSIWNGGSISEEKNKLECTGFDIQQTVECGRVIECEQFVPVNIQFVWWMFNWQL